MLHPLIYLRAEDGTGGGAVEPAADAAAAAANAAAAPPAPAAVDTPAPWAADIAAALAAPDPAAALDEYMRTKQQPYITKLEAERAEALNKSWVYDEFNENPTAALLEVATQVWGDDVGKRMVELVAAGASVEGAEAQAAAEAAGAAPAAAAAAGAAAETDTPIDLSKLPPEVREAVEFAQSEKEAKAAEKVADEQADLQAKAVQEYTDWHTAKTTAEPDIKLNTLHAYVAAADGDMEAGYAAYRADYPAPEKQEPPVTLGGSTTGGIQPARPSSGSFADTMGAVWDKMSGTAPR